MFIGSFLVIKLSSEDDLSRTVLPLSATYYAPLTYTSLTSIYRPFYFSRRSFATKSCASSHAVLLYAYAIVYNPSEAVARTLPSAATLVLRGSKPLGKRIRPACAAAAAACIGALSRRGRIFTLSALQVAVTERGEASECLLHPSPAFIPTRHVHADRRTNARVQSSPLCERGRGRDTSMNA